MTINFYQDIDLNNNDLDNRANDFTGGGSLSYAEVSRSVTQTINHNTATAIIWDTETTDTDNYWDVGTPTRLTVVTSGVYLVTCQLIYEGQTDLEQIQLRFHVNGVVVYFDAEPAFTSGNSNTMYATAPLNLTASDYVEIFAFHRRSGSGSTDLLFNASLSPKASIIRLDSGSSSGGNVRELLAADRTYFVATTGNDSNDGLTSPNAFLTLSKALETAYNLDTVIYNVTISLADGTYASSASILINSRLLGRGNLNIVGNLVTPANVVIENNAADGSNVIEFTGTSGISIGGVTLKRSNSTGANYLLFLSNTLLKLDSIVFAPSDGTSRTVLLRDNSIISALGKTLTFDGNQGDFIIRIIQSSVFEIESGTLEFINSASCSAGFVLPFLISMYNQTNATISGTLTGNKYIAKGNSVVRTTTGNNSEVPGTGTGTLNDNCVIISA